MKIKHHVAKTIKNKTKNNNKKECARRGLRDLDCLFFFFNEHMTKLKSQSKSVAEPRLESSSEIQAPVPSTSAL